MKVTSAIFPLLCLLIFWKNVETAKILSVLPLPAISHFTIFRAIFEGLVKQGHEIDLVAPFDGLQNITGINLIHVKTPNVFHKFFDMTIEDLRGLSTEEIVRMMFVNHMNFCEILLKPKEMHALKNSKKKYDLIILEAFTTDCLFGYAHVFKTPVVAVTTSEDLPWGTSRVGNPFNTAYMSHYFGVSTPPMSLWERFYNTALFVRVNLMQMWYLRQQESAARSFFGEDMPALNDLVANTSLFLLNSHFSLNQIRPNLPNVIEVAGLHLADELKPIGKEFSNFLGNSKFVHFSLGSVAKSVSIKKHIIEAIFEELDRRSIKVIWKLGNNEVPKDVKIPKNVMTTHWIPGQLNILCHPNLLFFITHNGLLSTQEAVYCGVPMMSIPSFADQFHNSETMTKKGVALKLEIETATKEDTVNIIKELIENTNYKENVKILSKQFKDRPRKPLDEALFWINYVLRYKGAPHFKSPSLKLSWYEYYLLDIIVVPLFFISLTLITLVMFFTSKVMKCRKCKKTVKQKSS